MSQIQNFNRQNPHPLENTSSNRFFNSINQQMLKKAQQQHAYNPHMIQNKINRLILNSSKPENSIKRTDNSYQKQKMQKQKQIFRKQKQKIKKQKGKNIQKRKVLVIIITENQHEIFQQFCRNLEEKSFQSQKDLAQIIIIDSYEQFKQFSKRQDQQYYILSSQKGIKQVNNPLMIRENWVVFDGEQRGSKKAILDVPSVVYYTKKISDLKIKLQSRGFIDLKQFDSSPYKSIKDFMYRKVPSIAINPACAFIQDSQSLISSYQNQHISKIKSINTNNIIQKVLKVQYQNQNDQEINQSNEIYDKKLQIINKSSLKNEKSNLKDLNNQQLIYYIQTINSPIKNNQENHNIQPIQFNYQNIPIGPGSNRIIDLRQYDKFMQNGVKVYRKRSPQRVYFRYPEQYNIQKTGNINVEKHDQRLNQVKDRLFLQKHDDYLAEQNNVGFNPYLATLDQKNIYNHTYQTPVKRNYNTYDYSQERQATNLVNNNYRYGQQYKINFPKRESSKISSPKKRTVKRTSQQMKEYLDNISSMKQGQNDPFFIMKQNRNSAANKTQDMKNSLQRLNLSTIKKKQQHLHKQNNEDLQQMTNSKNRNIDKKLNNSQKSQTDRQNIYLLNELNRTKIDQLKQSQIKMNQIQQNQRQPSQIDRFKSSQGSRSSKSKTLFLKSQEKINKIANRKYQNDIKSNLKKSINKMNSRDQYNNQPRESQKKHKLRFNSPQNQSLGQYSLPSSHASASKIKRLLKKSMDQLRFVKTNQTQQMANQYEMPNNNTHKLQYLRISKNSKLEKPQLSTVQTYIEDPYRSPRRNNSNSNLKKNRSNYKNNSQNYSSNLFQNSNQNNIQFSHINDQVVLQQNSILYLVDHLNSENFMSQLQNIVTSNDSIYKFKNLSQLNYQVKQSVEVYDFIFVFSEQIISRRQKEKFYHDFPWCYFTKINKNIDPQFVINLNQLDLREFFCLKKSLQQIIQVNQQRKQLRKSNKKMQLQRLKQNQLKRSIGNQQYDFKQQDQSKKYTHSQLQYFPKTQPIKKRLVNSSTNYNNN